MRAAPATSGAYVRDLDTGARALRRAARRAADPGVGREAVHDVDGAAAPRTDAPTLQTSAVERRRDRRRRRRRCAATSCSSAAATRSSAPRPAARWRAPSARPGSGASTGAVVGDESAFDARRSACCRGYDPDLGGVLSALAYDRGDLRGRARLDAARFAAGRFARAAEGGGRARVSAPSARRHARPTTAGRSPPCLAQRRRADPLRQRPVEQLRRRDAAQGRSARATATRGTTAAGAAVVRDTLGRLRRAPARSSTARACRASNRATPREVVRLLERMDDARRRRRSSAPRWRSRAQTGTVKAPHARDRRRPGAASVKTGTLRRVSALAGYCRTLGGRDVAFALMFNRANTSPTKAREDRIAAAIARLGAARRAPAPPRARPCRARQRRRRPGR